ncbi:MAG: PilZ domain-containing protein [Deltaproteobacteria bacterium]|nr:PilZ domain-containing protein [Deltaproteobacteria bacterium]
MAVQEREHPRYAHEAALTLHVGGDAYQGRTDNVSRGGLCATLAIGARDGLATGTDIEVDLQLVFEDERHSEPLRLPARVAWCTAVDEAHQIGIAFKPLPADLAQYLTMFLRFLDDGTKPTRSKRESTLDKRFG